MLIYVSCCLFICLFLLVICLTIFYFIILFHRANAFILTARLAPEVIRGAPYSEASDVYSLGTLAYDVFSRTIPFSDIHQAVVV
jgi:hypothetical protein